MTNGTGFSFSSKGPKAHIQRPKLSLSLKELLLMQVQLEVPPLGAAVPPAVKRVVMQALNRSPADRPGVVEPGQAFDAAARENLPLEPVSDGDPDTGAADATPALESSPVEPPDEATKATFTEVWPRGRLRQFLSRGRDRERD